MSNTRRAEPGKPLRQERFSSAEEFNRGLMANLVARRCAVLDRAEDRELIWFIQLLSHRPGGLRSLAAELLGRYSDRIGTPSMLKFGRRAGQKYNAGQVRAVRGEMPHTVSGSFMLRGEYDALEVMLGSSHQESNDDWETEARTRQAKEALGGLSELDRKAQSYPMSYPAKSFLAVCCEKATVDKLESWLTEFCLNPELTPARGPWYFHDLISCLREYQTQWVEDRRNRIVVTELGAQVYETLDYTLSCGRMTLTDGLARMGKSFAAKAYCEEHPGQARYCEVPPTNDEIAFFRAIARALGVSINLNSKAQELRLRIEETLQPGQLMLVLDEAHRLFPNLIDTRSLPSRLNWIMALVNAGVPVALITTPQFLRNQKAFEARTRWTSEQFTGRIGHYQKLPDSLAEADLEKIAASLLPEGDDKSIETLVRYAQGSAKYLAGIDAAICRARYLAGRDGRQRVTFTDVKRAIKESVIPSDSALAKALAEPPKRSRKTFLQPLETDFKPTLNHAEESPGPRRNADFDHSRGAAGPIRETRPALVESPG